MDFCAAGSHSSSVRKEIWDEVFVNYTPKLRLKWDHIHYSSYNVDSAVVYPYLHASSRGETHVSS